MSSNMSKSTVVLLAAAVAMSLLTGCSTTKAGCGCDGKKCPAVKAGCSCEGVKCTTAKCEKCCKCKKEIPKLKKADFYDNGKAELAAIKQAYFDMFERFNYPVPDILKTDEFWVCDFNQGDILETQFQRLYE